MKYSLKQTPINYSRKRFYPFYDGGKIRRHTNLSRGRFTGGNRETKIQRDSKLTEILSIHSSIKKSGKLY